MTKRERLRLEKENTDAVEDGALIKELPSVWADLREMHDKFGFTEAIKSLSPKDAEKHLKFRMKMIDEERKETLQAIKEKDGEGVVDGLIDLIVFAVGTLDALGIDSKKAWDIVHEANMTKEKGVNPSRPNAFGFPDLIKPDDWVEPDHTGNLGTLADIWPEESSDEEE